MKTIIKSLLDIVFPPRCPYCGEVGVDDNPCDKCRKLLNLERIFVKTCDKCGNNQKDCDCGKYVHLFSGISGAYWNRGDARDAVYGIKFHNRYDAAEYFGRQVALSFKQKFPYVTIDAVCAVPMSKKSKRDYNHAELIAKSVAKSMELPYIKKALLKTKDTEPQHNLKAEMRPQNVKGAYKAIRRFDGKTILLVDDVKTTGSTLSECAKQLRLAGATEVYSAVALITTKDTCKTDESEV